MKEFEEEINKNNNYTEKIINSFKSILITNNKSFLYSLEEQVKNNEESLKDINNNEKEEPKEEIKVIDHLKNFKDMNLVPIKSEYHNGKYKIKAIETKILGDNMSRESKELINDIFDEMNMGEDSYEDINSIVLTEEDIYETVVQFFYRVSDYVDNTEYDLIIEKKKIEVKNLVNKLLCFGIIKDAFLYRFNYYRIFGIFDMPEKEYNLTSKFFVLITDCIADNKENEEDFKTFKLLIILSQTFYVKKDGEKHYLIKDIRGHRLFNEIDYITKYLNYCINEEFQKSREKSHAEISEKSKKDIVFAIFLPFCNYMSELGVTKELLLKIKDSICEQYQLTDDLKANFNMMIQK